MRKLLIGVVLVLMLAVVAIAAFLFVPSPLQKWAVERGALLATGRQITFGGPFRLRAWPPLSITAADIRVANADWGQAAELAQIEALEASVDLLAFWRESRVVLERLLVRRPQINLEVAEDGRQNWAVGDGTQEAASRPRPSRSPDSCWATSGSRTGSSPTTTERPTSSGARRISTLPSPRPAPISR